jgi:hypothetical protein
LTLLVPPALLAIVVAVGVLGGQSEVAPAPATAVPAVPRIAVASQPLTAAVAAGGPLGPMLIPYEWRGKLGDRVDRFTIDDSVLALATPPRRSDWPRAVASPYPR